MMLPMNQGLILLLCRVHLMWVLQRIPWRYEEVEEGFQWRMFAFMSGP
jgi:hypothetical protein